ncbi:THUMP domain-containing protein [Sulfolobaceae archaeon RB850M]|jgi:tRNA acetyltransferase TAN1
MSVEIPKLLLTVKKNKENKCIIEILNRIFIKDLNAKAEEVVKNVILLYTSLSPMEAYGLLYSAPPSCVAKIFPIEHVINSINEDEIIREVTQISKNKIKGSFYVDCYSRGANVDCREIEIGIGIGLRDVAKVNFSNPDIIITINVVKDKAFVSYIKKGQEKVSVNSLS